MSKLAAFLMAATIRGEKPTSSSNATKLKSLSCKPLAFRHSLRQWRCSASLTILSTSAIARLLASWSLGQLVQLIIRLELRLNVADRLVDLCHDDIDVEVSSLKAVRSHAFE